MDNIDSNIDPAIESQAAIFTKFSLNSDFIQGENSYNYNIDNDHDHDQREHSHDADDAAAVSAAQAAQAAANLSNIISFNPMDHSHGSPTTGTQSSHHAEHSQDQQQLSFLHSALQMDAQQQQRRQQQQQQQQRQQHRSTGPSQSPSQMPKQMLVQDADSSMSFVVVNPSSTDGASRLGRPRKHNVTIAPNFEDTASKNYEEALVSRFRVDAKPVSGPGSRGGRKPLKPKQLDPKKPLSQQPTFAKHGMKLVLSSASNARSMTLNDKQAPADGEQNDSNGDKTTIILEDYDTLKAKGRSTLSDKRILQTQFSKPELVALASKPATSSGPTTASQHKSTLQSTIKTATLATAASAGSDRSLTGSPLRPSSPQAQPLRRSRKKRDIPGPLTGAFYDIYDPETLKPRAEKELDLIALGYYVKPASHARDIITILSFFNKFKKFFKDFYNLAPQDIEEGLRLPTPKNRALDNVVQTDCAKEETTNITDVSETMNQFFLQLLCLLLNKKKPITLSAMPKALDEFKSQVLTYGLPNEWRDDSEVIADPLVDESLRDNEVEFEPVDSAHPEMFDTTLFHYGIAKPLDHTPLDNPDFENLGLNSLKPIDRLILLRSMVGWCTSYSESVRNEISKQLAKQDSSGDKETYYISRFVKEGEKGVEQANISLKLHPRKKVKKNEDDSLLDPYTDATANPLDHHMSLRILDFYAGDAGVNGRFYLCRSCDPETGGLTTMNQMKQVLQSQESINDMLKVVQPSRFKLYVHDVTTMLKSVAHQVALSDVELLDPWYEVACNVDELREFTGFLQAKVDFLPQDAESTQVIQHLIDYLVKVTPMLGKFETIYHDYKGITTSRQSRKREQVTDLKENARKMKKMIKQSENPTHDFLNDGSDVGDEEDDEDDDFDMDGGEIDDEEDDDYKE